MMKSNSSFSINLWLITAVSLAVAGSHYCADMPDSRMRPT